MLSTGIYNQVEAANSFRFFTDRVQQYYYPCYYYGHWMIHDWYEKVPKDKRSAFFRLLYDRPQMCIRDSPKGFGSENMSRIAMLKPSDGLAGVKRFILELSLIHIYVYIKTYICRR